jgi:hypothetical protein
MPNNSFNASGNSLIFIRMAWMLDTICPAALIRALDAYTSSREGADMAENQTCEIHGLELRPATAGVSYGLPFRDDPYFEARRTLFPNSKMTVLGGCVIGSMDYEAEVLVCSKCREIEEQWLEENYRLHTARLFPE